jgi:hypothetical protein
MYIYICTAGIVQSVQQWTTDWAVGVRFPVGARVFTLLHIVQTGSVIYSAPVQMVPGKAADA